MLEGQKENARSGEDEGEGYQAPVDQTGEQFAAVGRKNLMPIGIAPGKGPFAALVEEPGTEPDDERGNDFIRVHGLLKFVQKYVASSKCDWEQRTV